MKRSTPVLAAAGAAALLLLAPAGTAHAASTIRDPNPPQYKLELEPKINLSPGGFFRYGGFGVGPGIRLSIPIMSPGFVKTINDSIAITFGMDAMHYDGYRFYGGNCRGAGCVFVDTNDFWTVYFPVAMQWNFWLTDKWSVFAEPGFAVGHTFGYDGCDSRFYDCSNTSIYFAGYAGGRFLVSDTLALTMRLGHPTLFSFGLSIFF